ncbi:Ig-like domain-containing protein [Clostridium sp. LQ25]|uniref:Ig-like domain-containing protein n=1 Tax=Clostridium TaxID=1485 RepID=UPI0005EB46BA|nr:MULTISPECIES: Ig-like domain-containing protein [Clostridium]AXB84825.1 cytochrome C biogenesis protein CcmH [Clostridium butyricum]UZT07948.1 Ig-like domain-containing protein [Clostridium sp. LQ25]
MKNYFKKFSIMFLMLLAVIGVGVIQNGTVAKAATENNPIVVAESGWQRFDDADKHINYSGSGWLISSVPNYTLYDKEHATNVIGDTATFKFYGSKFRIYSGKYSNNSDGIQISVDGVPYTYNQHGTNTYVPHVILFEKLNLNLGIHIVTITNPSSSLYTSFDCVDIDDTGHMIDYSVNITTEIKLNKPSMNLTVDESKPLIATTTPANAEVEWSSDNTGIVTVDDKGNITGIKEGQSTITAKIKGTNIKATCVVTVSKVDEPQPPVDEPTTGDGTLYIEMVDGNIKQAQNLDTSDFIKWYQNRDLDKTEKPFYKITNAKGNVEYLIHDKIVAFEIR